MVNISLCLPEKPILHCKHHAGLLKHLSMLKYGSISFIDVVNSGSSLLGLYCISIGNLGFLIIYIFNIWIKHSKFLIVHMNHMLHVYIIRLWLQADNGYAYIMQNIPTVHQFKGSHPCCFLHTCAIGKQYRRKAFIPVILGIIYYLEESSLKSLVKSLCQSICLGVVCWWYPVFSACETKELLDHSVHKLPALVRNKHFTATKPAFMCMCIIIVCERWING